MPNGNRLGPDNMGPMTGRGAGFCAGYNVPGFRNPTTGMGFGRGRGCGFGHDYGRFGGRWGGRFGRFQAAATTPALGKEEELDYLRRQTEVAEHELAALKQRIADLESLQ